MRALTNFLDSLLMSRVGAVGTLVTLTSIGVAIVVALYLTASDAIHAAGWLPLLAFALWMAVSFLLIAAVVLHRQTHSLWSPLDRIAMVSGLAASDEATARALIAAEQLSRECVAEAAVLLPALNGNHADVTRLVQGYLELEAEVARILAASDHLDDRWQLLWSLPPRGKPLTDMGLVCRAMLDEVTGYMAQRTRQLQWMLNFLRTGDDESVKYVHLWARHRHSTSAQQVASDPLA